MRIFFKILLFPISLILTVVVAVSAFMVGGFGKILTIISGLLFMGALLMGGLAIFKSEIYTWEAPIVIAVVSFLICPYGLPKLAEFVVEKLAALNEAIKAI